MELPEQYLIIRTRVCNGKLVNDELIIDNISETIKDLEAYRNDNIWSTAYLECFIFENGFPIRSFKFYK